MIPKNLVRWKVRFGQMRHAGLAIAQVEFAEGRNCNPPFSHKLPTAVITLNPTGGFTLEMIDSARPETNEMAYPVLPKLHGKVGIRGHTRREFNAITSDTVP